MSYSASLFLAFLLAIFKTRPFRCLMACWLESYCSFWGDGSLPLQAILIKSTDTIVKVHLAGPFPEFPHEFSHLRQGYGPCFTRLKWSMGKLYAHLQCWQEYLGLLVTRPLLLKRPPSFSQLSVPQDLELPPLIVPSTPGACVLPPSFPLLSNVIILTPVCTHRWS